ncbi:putative ABC transporter permease protein [Komagataeibacter europaeus]|uniref:ABC transporter permease protein n=1 Tax=Komagataeibacter europaeus TaxID=33995 RepID=A0A0M0EJA6_KOMEU|nr:iron ABC transporter permease [Komagataeibacter europaeus]KON65343.1 putative ABC transporter permease protein [Komagataeibacter europaeus]GBQ39179.1 ferrichrome Fe3+-siderophore transporter permease FecCD [Komagataeibacter europaeus LMG 18890]
MRIPDDVPASTPTLPSSDLSGYARQVRGAYRMLLRRRLGILAVIALCIVASVVLDFCLGPSGLSVGALIHTLLHARDVSAGQSVIVWQIRLPYALMAVCVGAALGLAGAEMQTVLANPLASPFTLGVSAAAAFGASLAIILHWRLPGVPDAWVVSADAFVFAIGSVLLLDMVSRRRNAGTGTVVLFGIALVFAFHALVSLLQFVANEDALQDLVFWTMGSLTRATWPKLGLLAAACVVVAPLSFRAAWKLTVLRMGEERAASLGVDVPRVRRGALLRVSILSALAVSFVGTIGFVGLVAPHIARRLLGEDHRFYLPGSMFVGALVMSLSSVAARNIMPGVVIPTGIVTALVGIPFFLAIVLRRQGLS